MLLGYRKDQELLSYYVLLAIAIVLASLLIVYGAAGLRGSDQYWYVADVAKIVSGGEHVTNNFFPGPMLRDGSVTAKNYFMHNSPVLVAVAWVSKLANPYVAWIIVNTIFQFLCLICVFLVLVQLTDKKVAVFCSILYVLSPIAIWQTINPLLEMYYSALVGVVLLSFIYRSYSVAFIGLYILLLLGVVSHPIFILPTLLWVIWSILEVNNNRRIIALVVGIVYLPLVFYCYVHKNVWFPSSFQPDLNAIVASAVPGKSNMYWHYANKIPSVDSGLFISKATHAFEKHILHLKYAPLYLFTNLALLAGLALCVFHFKRLWQVLIPFGLFGSQYIAMILLQQNHPRYQQIVAVVSFTFIGMFVYRFVVKEKYSHFNAKMVVAICMVVLFIASLFLVHRGRTESSDARGGPGDSSARGTHR